MWLEGGVSLVNGYSGKKVRFTEKILVRRYEGRGSQEITANWSLIGTKVNCRRPLGLKKVIC